MTMLKIIVCDHTNNAICASLGSTLRWERWLKKYATKRDIKVLRKSVYRGIWENREAIRCFHPQEDYSVKNSITGQTQLMNQQQLPQRTAPSSAHARSKRLQISVYATRASNKRE